MVSFKFLTLVCLIGLLEVPSATPTPSRRQDPVLRRDIWDNKGLNIDTESCNSQQQQLIANTIGHVKLYITAAHYTLRALDKTLFYYFFNEADLQTVDNALRNIYDRINHLGAPSIIFCEHPIKLSHGCVGSRIAWIELSEDHNETASAISLCPLFWQTPDLPNVCNKDSLLLDDGASGGDNKAFILFSHLLHMPYIAGPDIWIVERVIKAAEWCHVLAQLFAASDGSDPNIVPPTQNTGNYAHLAQWAFIRDRQKTTCPGFYPLWNVLTAPADGHSADWERTELRRLLSTDNGNGTGDVTTCGAGDDCSPLAKVLRDTSSVNVTGQGGGCEAC